MEIRECIRRISFVYHRSPTGRFTLRVLFLQVQAIKFVRKDARTVTSIDEFDRKVLMLKQTESELEAEIDKNYVEMEK